LFTNEGLAHLDKLKKLKELWIQVNGFNDTGMNYIAQLEDLSNLRIHDEKNDAQLSSEGLAQLSNLTSLENLAIGSVPASETSKLNKLVNLKTLNLRTVPDGSFLNISGLQNLESLHLGDSGIVIQDDDLACLAKLKNLKKFWIRQGPNDIKAISDKGMAYLINLDNLETLGIGGPGITDKGLACLADKTNLWYLQITGDFTDAGLEHLAAIPKLERLFIYSPNKFSPIAIQRLKDNLPNLGPFSVEQDGGIGRASGGTAKYR